MSASHLPVLDAIAFQLAAALEQHELDVARMVETWLDMDLYRTVSEQVEEIRRYTAALPQLSVQWVELLIAHAELVHWLWRVQYGKAPANGAELAALRERHAQATSTLRARCLRLISTPGR